MPTKMPMLTTVPGRAAGRSSAGSVVLSELQQIARICTKPTVSVADVLDACGVLRDVLGAEEAYVVRAGDPAFIRMGCGCDPDAYEIKQKGYWILWRQAALNPQFGFGMFDVADRLVTGGKPLTPGAATTHFAGVLPGDESNSEVLVVRGPWARGLTADQIHFVEAARLILAHGVSKVLDAHRRDRQRQQLESLANVSNAFNEAGASDDVLTAVATALAKSSTIDWVVIDIYNEAGDGIVDRALNVARFSHTNTAGSYDQGFVPTPKGEPQMGVGLARTGQPFLVRDVHAPDAWITYRLASAEAYAPVRKFYERAHIVSIGVFPVVFQEQALGAVSFASSTRHEFDETEVEFLRALVAQASTAIKGLRLYQDLQDSREEVRQRVEWFRSLVQNATDLIAVIDPDTTVRYLSPSITRVLGYASEKVTGRKLLDRIHREDTAGFLASLHELMTKPGAVIAGEGRTKHRSGEWRHLEFTGTDQRSNRAINGLVLNVRDVTERKLLEEQLRHQALHDPLTKLANRTRFTDRLEHELLRSTRHGTQVEVLFMDLDNFKGVNDSLGHSAGDRLLTQVAERVQECLRPADTVARLGGDEFALLLEDIRDQAEATTVTERIFAALHPPFLIEGKELRMGASIGIVLSGPDRAGSAEALLRDADTAMYVAKAHGKGRFEVFEETMQTAMLERLELLADLQRAVDQREFVLHYQPVMSLGDGQLYGVEALVRWQHPTRGLIQPGDFIPLAEESGTIVALGGWILNAACEEAAEWQRTYPDVAQWTLSINVSAKQLQHPGFVGDVHAALERTGLEPHRLILEITESVMMQDVSLMMSRLHELKELGIRLAIDDFGTGYSSLSYLRQFPFDLLKIDKSFIDDVGDTGRDKELTRAIIELGKTLDLELVAEGIERNDQLARLKILECELGQGFYFAAPLEHQAVDDLLARLQTGDAADTAA
jgi:diguanylate cyclase (GGDEF)-like protein/PAS domain S-box-containing protein